MFLSLAAAIGSGGKNRTSISVLAASLICSGCKFANADHQIQHEPDWRTFRSTPAETYVVASGTSYSPSANRFLVADLKHEADSSLAKRLLGAVGSRIAFIDRHTGMWPAYQSDDQPIEKVDLYTRPQSWGTASGICKVEKFEVSFSDDGRISSVSVRPRFGIEGPLVQPREFDFDEEAKNCALVPVSHAPSYFPADGSIEAHDVASLLVEAIDEAANEGDLNYRLDCKTIGSGPCLPGIRRYLGRLRLDRINDISKINCPYMTGLEAHCFTLTVDENSLGPFPKYITIKGSTYMNRPKVFSVEVRESSTYS